MGGQGGQTFTLSKTAVPQQMPIRDTVHVEDLPNHCANGGIPQAIFENDQITETYCRCQTGSYGRTCSENFVNPCGDEQQYHEADPSFGGHYFIECSWGIPYLMKCPATTLWSQELLTCAVLHAQPEQQAPAYGGYGQCKNYFFYLIKLNYNNIEQIFHII